ncbi:MAG: hypothetical protein LBK82_15785 [Planctomycetaceae bacterium]|nr:hypothetical protein [Planctomycetaceae bacterium]
MESITSQPARPSSGRITHLMIAYLVVAYLILTKIPLNHYEVPYIPV